VARGDGACWAEQATEAGEAAWSCAGDSYSVTTSSMSRCGGVLDHILAFFVSAVARGRNGSALARHLASTGAFSAVAHQGQAGRLGASRAASIKAMCIEAALALGNPDRGSWPSSCAMASLMARQPGWSSVAGHLGRAAADRFRDQWDARRRGWCMGSLREWRVGGLWSTASDQPLLPWVHHAWGAGERELVA